MLGDTSKRHAPPQVLGFILAIATSVILGLALATLNVSVGAILAGATLVVLLAPILYRVVLGRFDLFEPITLFAAMYALIFVVRPAYMLAESENTFVIGLESVNYSNYVTEMQVAALIGAVGFVFGYEFLRIRSISRKGTKTRDPNIRTLSSGGVILLFLGLLSTILYWGKLPGGYGAIFAGRSDAFYETTTQISSYLIYAPNLLIPGAMLMLIVWLKTRRLWPLLLSVAGICLVLAVRLPIGSRLTLLPLLLGLIVFYYLYRGRRPGGAAVATGIILIAVLWSLVLQSRYQDPGTGQDSYGASISTIITDPVKVLDPVLKGQDLAMAPGLASAMGVIPEKVPFQYGTGLVGDIATRGIPRQFWANKPLPAREKVINELWPKGYAFSIANPEFSVLFHFYVDGSFIGILLGLSLYGFAFRALRDFTFRGPRDPIVLLIYALLMCNIPMLLRDSPTDSLMRLGFSVAPLVLVAWLATRSSRSQNNSFQ